MEHNPELWITFRCSPNPKNSWLAWVLFYQRTIGVTTLRQRTRLTARQLEVPMLVIDEIHSILAGTFREQRFVLNAIRFLAPAAEGALDRLATAAVPKLQTGPPTASQS